MKIPFASKEEVIQLAREYDNEQKPKNTELESYLVEKMPKAVTRKFVEKEELINIAKWKWSGGRTWQLVDKNSAEDIKDFTKASFATHNENLRIQILRGLHGVNWPMASVILHFAFPEKYPIFDVRAMNSIGSDTKYSNELWAEYCKTCQEFCQKHNVEMRDLDRALWKSGKQ
ncbi:MAG: hypothetical protein QM537_01165 [Candidatus Symbiobacter sp.]|nr:hypothetical protein [Candidatus Symbiobacter sp.]